MYSHSCVSRSIPVGPATVDVDHDRQRLGRLEPDAKLSRWLVEGAQSEFLVQEVGEGTRQGHCEAKAPVPRCEISG